jgi:hypothetical protein
VKIVYVHLTVSFQLLKFCYIENYVNMVSKITHVRFLKVASMAYFEVLCQHLPEQSRKSQP